MFGGDLSENPLKNLAKASDFQAEYEGSIPFTRSNFLKHLSRCQLSIRTSRLISFGQMSVLCSAARRFLVPVMICRVVRFTWFGSTLGVMCRPCAELREISQFGIAEFGKTKMAE